MKKAFPILAALTAVFLAYAFYQAMFVAPTDFAQGDVYRIIYYHVPSAWTAFLLFFINFIASMQYLASAKPSSQRAVKWIVIAVGIIGFIAPFLPQVKQQLPTGMYPSSVATTPALPDFPSCAGTARTLAPSARLRTGNRPRRRGCAGRRGCVLS